MRTEERIRVSVMCGFEISERMMGSRGLEPQPPNRFPHGISLHFRVPSVLLYHGVRAR